ncbi:MAG TPA: carboxymuconolactone decarboxylase family protein [Candidatus Deferrimicrobiaceae bacterium]|nr:carboxymuconolactone decarboxylase family protein [Candidatus Deferrimicrobiaceae bacterium]
MPEDALWYEAAHVVGVTNALNVVADALGEATLGLPALDPATGGEETRTLFNDIRAFYGAPDVPLPFRLIAHDPDYAADVWAAVKRAFGNNRLSRRLKEALAFAVSLTSRSRFGTAFHLAEMRRLGTGERGVMEVIGVTQMFSSYTKIADTLQLEPDMGHIAPPDPTPAPGGRPAPRGREGRGRRQVSGTSRAKISKGDRRVASRASRISASPAPGPVSRRVAKKPV